LKKPPNANRAARSTAGPALLSLPRPFILTLVTLILPLLIIGCSFDYRDSRLSESLEEEVANNVLKKYVHTSVKNGVPAFEVRAESSRIYFKSKRAELSEVSFTEFDTEGEALAEGRAGGATVFTGSDNVEQIGKASCRERV